MAKLKRFPEVLRKLGSGFCATSSWQVPEVEKITLSCPVTQISGLLLEITNSALDVEIKLKGTDKSVSKYSEAYRDSIVAVGRGSDPLITRALSLAASPTLMIVYPSTVTESLICRGAFK
jgi:hypothetical protein